MLHGDEDAALGVSFSTIPESVCCFTRNSPTPENVPLGHEGMDMWVKIGGLGAEVRTEATNPGIAWRSSR